MPTRSANVVARVEPEVKVKTEAILNNIGLSMSDAVNLFCKQIIFQNGIPFSLKADTPSELDSTDWSDDKLAAELQKGIDDIEAGRARPAEEVFADLNKRFSYAV